MPNNGAKKRRPAISTAVEAAPVTKRKMYQWVANELNVVLRGIEPSVSLEVVNIYLDIDGVISSP